jgi:hypothetical protein
MLNSLQTKRTYAFGNVDVTAKEELTEEREV